MRSLVKYVFFLSGIFLLNSISLAQQCSVIITGSEAFRISLNKKPLHPSFTKAIRINQLDANSKYMAEIVFKQDSTFRRNSLFLFDAGFIHLYEVDRNGFHLKKMQPELTYTPNKEMLTVDFTTSGTQPVTPDTIPADSLAADTTYKPPFDHYYRLEDYEGRIGCPWPIPEEKVAEVKNLLQNEPLEERKLEKAKTAFMQMDSLCILMDDVVTITRLFEYEETRLQFAKFLAPNFFDIDQVGKLEEVFDFENSMDEIKAYIGTQIAKPEKN